jgi:hypothetical protein
MQDCELYGRILGIAAPWRVERVELQLKQGEVHVYLAHENQLEWPCAECGASCALYDHQAERQWRHLDTCQYRTILHAGPEWSNNSVDCVGGGCPPRSHSPGEWNRCQQRPTETQVSNITHCGIGHFQAPNIARDTFLAVTHVPHLFAA